MLGRRWLAASLLTLTVVGCRQPELARVEGREVSARLGAVASVDPVASAIGADVLIRGGHAVDAAVAVALALAVTWPEAGNIGGGGFMLVRESNGAATFVDYRERAPAAAREDMFLDDGGELDRYHVRLGYRPVGVPGTVAGLWLAHQRYGRLPWSDLVMPAVDLAERGVVVRDSLSRSIAAAPELRDDPEASRIFLRDDGSPLAPGDLLVQSDLAASLRAIADDGADAFYRGVIAERIVAASQAAGGPHTTDDFAAYEAVTRAPLRGTYRGHEVLAGPPPTSGGAILIEALKQLEGYDLRELGLGSAAELHLIGESLRRAFLDRYRFLGDPDFAPFDVGSLLTDSHAAALRSTIDRTRATPSDALAGDLDGTLPPEGGHTTHFSVIDRDGNAVSNTYTLEESWGAKLVAPGTGIVLNNEMHDFNVTPGRSTRGGRVGTRPNRIEPGKRMLSSMCPVIVTKDGAPFLIAGSPGGRTIPSTVLRVVTAAIDHGQSPAAAVAASRVHHQLYPDRLSVERSVGDAVLAELSAMGHGVREVDAQGDCHVIGVDVTTGEWVAVADDRRDGGAAGVSAGQD